MNTTATEPRKTGKTKILLPGPDQNHALLRFTDILSGDDGQRIDTLPLKGVAGVILTSHIFLAAELAGIPTHLVRRTQPDTLLVRWLDMFPLEVVVRRFAFGSMCIRYGLKEGEPFPFPFVEFFLKSESHRDPMIAKSCAAALGLASPRQLDEIEHLAHQVWDTAEAELAKLDIQLLDFKLEFGSTGESIVLGDEIGFDTIRIRDQHTHVRLDKDVWYLKQPGVEVNLHHLLDRIKPWDKS